MYIPHEIGDEVYFFKKYEFNILEKGTITSVTISKQGAFFEVEGNFNSSLALTLRIDEIYTRKTIAQEELLRRVVDYANEKINF